MSTAYKTVTDIAGPLLIVEGVSDIVYDELCEIELPDGSVRLGNVLEACEGMAVIQLFESAQGTTIEGTKVRFLGRTFEFGVSEDLLGRVFSGSGKPVDGGPDIVPEMKLDINGAPINPYSRAFPNDFIQTGVATIDVINTLVRGQKLPIFSGAGLPHNQLAAQIARQARVLSTQEVEQGKVLDSAGEEGDEKFAVVFGAMGVTFEEAEYFRNEFERSGALSRAVLLLNTADHPVVERIATPRIALTIAEY
ncbi:V-type ATP synthase subunit B, partial [Candidatus Peregrinibacteria bacterium CG22_combo_CG10-13_8_21_14_all_49_11]